MTTPVSYSRRPDAAADPSLFDFGHLDRLRHGVRAGADASAQTQHEVARQFEAVFIQMLLKQARQVSEQMPGLFDSPASRLTQSLRDEQAALALADPGIGLSEALLAQMRGEDAALLDPLAHPPEAAASRLPWLQSRIGDGRRQVADSIDSLINLLTRGKIVQRVAGAVQGAPEHIRNFVDRMLPQAEMVARASGVPSQLMLGQAALESGWGQREIRHADGSSSHNLFGIKAGSSWKGDVARVLTTEIVDGRAIKLEQNFRAYDSYADSFADYARLISQSDRYQSVMQAPTAEEAAYRVQEAGYATDPAYAEKLISIMSYFQTH